MSNLKNAKLDEAGNAVVSLPVSQEMVTLRRPKGRDIEQIELRSKAIETNTGVLMATLSVLSGMPVERLEDLDAEDLECLGDSLATFPVFRKLLKDRP